MTPAEFQAWVMRSWGVWPCGNTNPMCDLLVMGLGLGGETGEVQELLVSRLRNGTDIRADICLELGDVAHYAARMAGEFNLSIDTMDMVGDGAFSDDLLLLGLDLGIAASRAQELIKKLVRDQRPVGCELTEAIAGLLRAIARLARVFSINMEDVMAANQQKVDARVAAMVVTDASESVHG